MNGPWHRKSPGYPNLAPSSLASGISRRGERPAHRADRAPVGIHTKSRGNPPRRWPPERTRRPVERSCPPDTTQSHRTALRSRQPLGSAEVTHPFHPLRGHRFVVLKVRRVSGVETLSLRHADLGSFAMPREWTDWAPPGAPQLSDLHSEVADCRTSQASLFPKSRFQVHVQQNGRAKGLANS